MWPDQVSNLGPLAPESDALKFLYIIIIVLCCISSAREVMLILVTVLYTESVIDH